MRVLLRDVRSGKYFAGDAKWTRKAARAVDFGRSVMAAMLAAQRATRRRMEIVLAFEDALMDMVVPLKNLKDYSAIPGGDLNRGFDF